MNFLRGQLRVEPDGAVFANDSVRFPVASFEGNTFGEREVDLGIRPEHLFLVDKGAPEALGEVTIQLTELHGPERIAWGRIGTSEIAMRMSPEVPVEPGVTYGFGAHLHRVNIYDAATGQRC